ncbi:hypothetical protein JTB14_012659 [Gonioctena quinquepunctata]|nr:hypothetical protein JTB14_012659 [Gonioctena quinquepunctata]
MGNEDVSNKDIYALLTKVSKDAEETRVEIKRLREEFQNKVTALEISVKNSQAENQSSKLKLLATDRRIRRNTFIIFGHNSNPSSVVDYVIKLVNEKVKVTLTEQDINNCFTNHKMKNEPIILELLSNFKKSEIFSKIPQLKNSILVFVEDLPYKDRQERKYPVVYLKEAKSKNIDAKLKKNTLPIDGETFALMELNDNCALGTQGRSSPSTPFLQ